MGRTRSRSSKAEKQGSAAKKSRRKTSIQKSLPSQSSNQADDQSVHQSDHHPKHTSKLLAYNFLIPLIIAFLNDGDVMSRLLTLDKSIKQLIPKYTFKRIYKASVALAILESDPGFEVSVARVQAETADCDTLLKVIELSCEPLKEVHYTHCYQETDANIPDGVTHLQLPPPEAAPLVPQFLPGDIPDSVIELTSYVSFENVGSLPSSVQVVTLMMSLDEYRPELIPDTVTQVEIEFMDFLTTRVMLPGMFPSSMTKLDLSGTEELLVAA